MNKNSIIFLDGNQVFSDFRKIGLLEKVQKIVPKIKEIESKKPALVLEATSEEKAIEN